MAAGRRRIPLDTKIETRERNLVNQKAEIQELDRKKKDGTLTLAEKKRRSQLSTIIKDTEKELESFLWMRRQR